MLLVVIVATVLPVHAFAAAETQAGARIDKHQCARGHGVNGEGKENDVIAYLLQANGQSTGETRLDATSSARVALCPDCVFANSRVARKVQP